MGTRSLTIVYNDDSARPVVNMYRQYDGYPSGHGVELARFLNSKTLVNGIPMDANRNTIANGMGCIAASMIGQFKVGAGNIYLYPTDSRDCGQDYEYHVKKDSVTVFEAFRQANTIFHGTWEQFGEFCKSDK